MPPQNELPVALQTETSAPLPGAGVRTIVATVMVGGVPTPVQMQVVSLSDGLGNIIDSFADYNWQKAMLFELREIRTLVSEALGVFPIIPEMASSDHNAPA